MILQILVRGENYKAWVFLGTRQIVKEYQEGEHSYFAKIPKGSSYIEIENNTRYFIGKNNKINYDITNKLFDNIYIFKHVNVYYPGIVYFNSKEDVRRAISMLGKDKIKQLFID